MYIYITGKKSDYGVSLPSQAAEALQMKSVLADRLRINCMCCVKIKLNHLRRLSKIFMTALFGTVVTRTDALLMK